MEFSLHLNVFDCKCVDVAYKQRMTENTCVI